MLFTNPGSGNNYLGSLQAQCATVGTLMVYDRLAHMGGLSGTVTTAQTVNLTIPANRNANANGSDVEWFLEHYADTGSTGVTVTVTYTDQDNNTGQTTTVALTATSRASRLHQIIPATAGDYIKSIQSVTHVTTGTAGNYGVTVAKRIGQAPVGVVNQITVLDAINLGLPIIPNDACLWLVQLCSTTSTGFISGQLAIIQG
jgi:hypothetical protein